MRIQASSVLRQRFGSWLLAQYRAVFRGRRHRQRAAGDTGKTFGGVTGGSEAQ